MEPLEPPRYTTVQMCTMFVINSLGFQNVMNVACIDVVYDNITVRLEEQMASNLWIML